MPHYPTHQSGLLTSGPMGRTQGRAQNAWRQQIGLPPMQAGMAPPPGGGVNPFATPRSIVVDEIQSDAYQRPPPLPAMQSGASPRQTGFSGPIEWDVMDMDPTAGVQNELVEPLQEKAPGRQLDWDVLTKAGMSLGGFQVPSANLGFSQQAVQNNPSPYE